MHASTTLPACSVLLLSGGRGQRMGGRDKGLIEWRGQPLIAWLHDLTRPLSDDLIISCNRNTERYAAYADQLVADAHQDFQGPLAGIRAGMAAARHEQMLVLPCDAPLVDRALIESLLAHAGSRPVVIRQGSYWQPLFCLLPTRFKDDLEQAWHAGERSPQRWFGRLSPVAIDCALDDLRLANLNTPETLAENAAPN
ncbi:MULTISPECIES: molybdenum cofactor guanylyltransferase MobA [unclassified Pseudomonas]|uniref:molybdenum cofactor guanylyltransferase MobA n=1 Tax=unclassified Pseudomonas TaxID=196821 RepID=UPI000EDC8A4A|nr:MULTISPECIES: molybdenum cofactor guanylyltransferase MobA [unclassified Pseudomonas]HBZ95810.1 molybdenum cofactor guanylyltransferase MobA [Pseudomonas sp.]